MIEVWLGSTKLFVQGKLFREPRHVARQSAIGIAITAGLCAGLGAVLPLWVAAGIAGLVGGFLQPWLFRDLKYQ